METRQDKRVQKTKKALKEGLIHFINIKPYNTITVKELTDYCDLNRGTFYIHYTDIFDMVNQIENELFDEFTNILNRHPINTKDDTPTELLIELYQFIEANKDLTSVLLGKHGDFSFFNQFKVILKQTCIQHWQILFNQNHKYYDLFFTYLVSGCFGIVELWLNNEIEMTPEELANVTSTMIVNGCGVLK